MAVNKTASQISGEFWTVFGKYMAPVLSAEGEKINWINYKTGVKNLRFNMQVYNNSVLIAIEIDHADILVQQQQFEQLSNFKKQFQFICGSQWQWEEVVVKAENRNCHRVKNTLENVSILNQSQWPEIISFFKTNLILLDEFWSNFKFAFE